MNSQGRLHILWGLRLLRYHRILQSRHSFSITLRRHQSWLARYRTVVPLQKNQANAQEQLEFALQLLTMVCYGFVKLSILAFYRQIFVINKRTAFDIVTIVAGWVIFLWTITFILIIIFPCGGHVDNNQGSAAQQIKHCLVIGYTSLDGLAASDFILDLFLFLLPLPMVSPPKSTDRFELTQ